jgi:hypothetical protein
MWPNTKLFETSPRSQPARADSQLAVHAWRVAMGVCMRVHRWRVPRGPHWPYCNYWLFSHEIYIQLKLQLKAYDLSSSRRISSGELCRVAWCEIVSVYLCLRLYSSTLSIILSSCYFFLWFLFRTDLMQNTHSLSIGLVERINPRSAIYNTKLASPNITNTQEQTQKYFLSVKSKFLLLRFRLASASRIAAAAWDKYSWEIFRKVYKTLLTASKLPDITTEWREAS